MKQSQILRDESIKQVEEHADQEWLDAAYEAVVSISSTFEFFTTDDVWSKLSEPPREPRAMGAVMNRARRDGVIEATSYWVQSSRPAAHARPLRVWKRAGEL